MTRQIRRRTFLQMLALSASGWSAQTGAALAAGDAVTIGWPNDVPTWDPNQRFSPDSQSIFKMVFDQPLDQNPQLELVPHLVKSWALAEDGSSMPIELRDDIVFHNGDKLTTEDFRYTFFERIKSGLKLDTANSWRKVQEIEIHSPTKATMRFELPRSHRAAMAGVPRQLRRPQEVSRIRRRRGLRQEAGRQRALPAGRLRAQLPHRARAQ